jgi:predicted RNA-binding protein Jag
MTEAERNIVRAHLRWRVDLVTRSEGEGPARHLVVIPI